MEALHWGYRREAINLGEVVQSLEALQLIACGTPWCQLLPVCLKEVLAEAVEAFVSALCRHSLADLIRDQPAIRQQLRIPLLVV